MSRAEYMRNYRAKQKLGALSDEVAAINTMNEPRIAELEAEVKHLKAELAKRPEFPQQPITYGTFGETDSRIASFGHSRPAPKPGRK